MTSTDLQKPAARTRAWPPGGGLRGRVLGAHRASGFVSSQPLLPLACHVSVVSTVSPEGMDSRGKEGVPRVKATDTMVGGNGGVPWGYGLKTPGMPGKADSVGPCDTVFSMHTLLRQGLTSQSGTVRDEQELTIKQSKPNTLLSPTVCGPGSFSDRRMTRTQASTPGRGSANPGRCTARTRGPREAHIRRGRAGGTSCHHT